MKHQRLKKRASSKSDKGNSLKKLRPVISDEKLNKLLKVAKTPAGKRHLASLAPQVHESTKRLLLLKGTKLSEKGSRMLRDLAIVRKPHSLYLSKRNQTRLVEAFEKPEDFEYLGGKNEAPLFVMASSTKKRPLRLFAGRLFSGKIFDLYEMDVVNFSGMTVQKDALAPAEGSKPLVLFQGTGWDLSGELIGLKNVFADIFGGIVAEKILLTGFDHCFILTAFQRFSEVHQTDKVEIKISHFHIALKQSPDASDIPMPALTDLGPTINLTLARSRLPDTATAKVAHKLPNETYNKKTKNVSTTDLLEKRAKVWANKEDYTRLNTRHAHPKIHHEVEAVDEEPSSP